MRKFMLNIQTGKIHNGQALCNPGSRTAEANRKWFDTYEEAKNFYGGDRKKGTLCVRCFADGVSFEK